MSRKLGRRVVIIVVVLVAVIFAGWALAHKSAPDKSQSKSSAGSRDAITASNIYYPVPNNWTKLSPQALSAQGAVSGITRSAAPAAAFTVAIEPAASTPASETELKNSTLAALKNFPGFELLSYSQVKVAGQDGQQFVYRFGTTDKTRQQLIVIIYKEQACSLLFSSREADFASQSADFSAIQNSFRLK